jgi:hypothetical protein
VTWLAALIHHHGQWIWLITLGAGTTAKILTHHQDRTDRLTLAINLPASWPVPGPRVGDVILLLIVPPPGAGRDWAPPDVTGPPGWTRWASGTSQVSFWKVAEAGDPPTVVLTGNGRFGVKPCALEP